MLLALQDFRLVEPHIVQDHFICLQRSKHSYRYVALKRHAFESMPEFGGAFLQPDSHCGS
jgi:hypothetical protein